jgi:transcription initiation factor TFIIIB Brf1 subunit/transcription initiation factor TFIIB
MDDEETITKYCHDLKLEKDEKPEHDAIKKSIEIYNIGKYLLKKHRCESCGKIINRRPPEKKTIMATSIYIASILTGQRRTQREIVQYLGTNEITLRGQYRKIMNLPGYKEEDKIEE